MSERGNQPTSRAYEFVDPRPGRPERFVGHGSGARPWLPLWENRELDGGPLGAWFRELDEVALLPREDHSWLPSSGMTADEAERLAAARVRQIVQWAGSWPLWLLNHAPRPRMHRPVYRVSLDGDVVRYYSIRQAATAAGVWLKAMQQRLKSGRRDCNGYAWVMGSDAAP